MTGSLLVVYLFIGHEIVGQRPTHLEISVLHACMDSFTAGLETELPLPAQGIEHRPLCFPGSSPKHSATVLFL